MMDACKEAGLIDQKTDKSLFLSLELEAASLYCLNNGNIDEAFFKEGEYYIICDLGGGTGDIVAHLVGANKNLSEIHPSCGGIYGSNEIDRHIFEDIIYPLFGCKNFKDFLSKIKVIDNEEINEKILFNDWRELERKIKDFKKGTNNINADNNKKCPINFSLFKDIFDDNIDLKLIVEEYNKNKYISDQANKIYQIINDINGENNEEIKALILVGGYSSNEVLVSLIEEGLNNTMLILKSTKSCLAIMEGATIFGMNPYIIKEREAKYTIGMGFRDLWNEDKHAKMGKKVFNSEINKYECKNCFSKFITIKQKLKLNDIISHSYKLIGNRTCLFKFYKTKNPKDPIFTFVEGIELIGECVLDAGKDNNNPDENKLLVELKFGGTFIDVKAKNLKSGKNINAKFNFT